MKGKTLNKYYIETYGCQMNVSDSEIVSSILNGEGLRPVSSAEDASLILLNTCSIREKAETSVKNRLRHLSGIKTRKPHIKIGLLGCMAERLKKTLLEKEKIVDIIVGPDAYRDLPDLLRNVEKGQQEINVTLSQSETYHDISPFRSAGAHSAFVSITRGCDNMCTFCVVPFTRGRERSRDPKSILKEIRTLETKGCKEIILLGQNVDSYLWYGGGAKKHFHQAPLLRKKTALRFSDLLSLIAGTFPNQRIRFTTSNPQDMTLDVLQTMKKHKNICRHIHLPIQSGSNRILKKMNRQHTREEYLTLIDNIKNLLPDCAITHDIIVGFPTEKEEDHAATISLMEKVRYTAGFMFAYSERPGTLAAKKFLDDVPTAIKKKRLQEIIEVQQKHSQFRAEQFVGKTVSALIEKDSKKSAQYWSGRVSQNLVVVFPKKNGFKPGDMVDVTVTTSTKTTLIGKTIYHSEKI